LFLEKPEVAGRQIWTVGGLTDLGDVMLCQKSGTRAEEWEGAWMNTFRNALVCIAIGVL